MYIGTRIWLYNYSIYICMYMCVYLYLDHVIYTYIYIYVMWYNTNIYFLHTKYNWLKYI